MADKWIQGAVKGQKIPAKPAHGDKPTPAKRARLAEVLKHMQQG